MFWTLLLAVLSAIALFYILKNRLAIFWPSTGKMIKIVDDLADIKKTDIAYDLGSGDGRIVKKLAKKAKLVIGVEHSKIMNSIARKKLKGLKNAKIVDGNLFEQDISDANVVVAYLSRLLIPKLERKITEECKKGTRIILIGYKFRGLKPVKERRTFLMTIRLYIV